MGNESSRESVEAIGTTTSELSAIELLTGRDQTPFDPVSERFTSSTLHMSADDPSGKRAYRNIASS